MLYLKMEVQHLINHGLCLNCNEKTTVNRLLGHTECWTCGKIGDALIEIDKESVQFNGEESASFSTSGLIDTLLPQSSMGSYLVGKGYNSVKRLHTWGRVPTVERSLKLVFDKIQQALSAVSVDYSAIFNDAKIIYFQLHSRDSSEYTKKNVISRGKIRDGLIAYIVSLAAQNNQIVLQKETLHSMFGIDEATFKAGKKKYNTLLLKQTANDNTKTGILDHFTRFIHCIQLSEEDSIVCRVICHRVIQLGILQQRHPITCAAGILVFIGGIMPKLKDTLSKEIITDIAEKTIPVIKKITVILIANKKYIVPLEFSDIIQQ